MKLPRRKFLQLTAGAAALPVLSLRAGARTLIESTSCVAG